MENLENVDLAEPIGTTYSVKSMPIETVFIPYEVQVKKKIILLRLILSFIKFYINDL